MCGSKRLDFQMVIVGWVNNTMWLHVWIGLFLMLMMF